MRKFLIIIFFILILLFIYNKFDVPLLLLNPIERESVFDTRWCTPSLSNAEYLKSEKDSPSVSKKSYQLLNYRIVEIGFLRFILKNKKDIGTLRGCVDMSMKSGWSSAGIDISNYTKGDICKLSIYNKNYTFNKHKLMIGNRIVDPFIDRVNILMDSKGNFIKFL